MLHLFIDILRNSILITGLVIIMMMMIESLNIESKGLFFKGLRKTKTGQVLIGALLGAIPGCMGGFATISLYTHRMLSFGALVAMMIASSGDEAFTMLVAFPHKALIIFMILFILAVVTGIIVDKIYDRKHAKKCHKHDHEDCGVETGCEGFELHDHEDTSENQSHCRKIRHFGWKRIIMFIGLAIFIGALATGHLSHDHSTHLGESCSDQECACCCDHNHTHHEESHTTFNLLSEDWMNVLFAGLSVLMLFVLIFSSDHFIDEHLWKHVVLKHLPKIFAWTFGVLLVLGIALHYLNLDQYQDIEQHKDIVEYWISNHIPLLILLATLIGIIPESGPHLIFVVLFIQYPITFPVLLASSISQDGHASIPLLAESKKSFIWAKLINCGVALLAGYVAMLFM